MSNVLRSENKEDDIIKKIISVAGYSGIPLVLLVGFITIGVGFVRGDRVSNAWLLVGIQQTVPALISLGLIPLFIFTKIEKNSPKLIGINKYKHKLLAVINIFIIIIFLSYLAIAGLLFSSRGIFVLHYAVIAITEEVLVRGIITYKLKELFENKVIAITVSALIFSLVFHSTDGLFANLLWRVPFAIIMSILLETTGNIWFPITLHWIWDVIITLRPFL